VKCREIVWQKPSVVLSEDSFRSLFSLGHLDLVVGAFFRRRHCYDLTDVSSMSYDQLHEVVYVVVVLVLEATLRCRYGSG
jgi:hypothetical protein